MTKQQTPYMRKPHWMKLLAMVFNHHKNPWYTLLPGVLRRAILNPSVWLSIQKLSTREPLSSLAHANPRFLFKCFTANYLARSFDVQARARSFLYHHKLMQEVLPEDIFRQITLSEVKLATLNPSEHLLEVTVGLTPETYCDKEGEWSLFLRLAGEVIYLISFMIVPGRVVGSESSKVILVSRLQGVKQEFQKIKIATKMMSDIAPPSILLAAAEGMALALGIREMAAVVAVNQPSFEKDYEQAFTKAYDEFFTNLGFEKAHGFLSSTMPFPERPMTLIKPGHKLRTKEKRRIKRELSMQCFRLFSSEVSEIGSLETIYNSESASQ